jgi:para-nitrobenzyl esterase
MLKTTPAIFVAAVMSLWANVCVATVAIASTLSPALTINQESLVGRQRDEITVLTGIPFAQAPIADQRWQAPQAHLPRQGLQQATGFAPGCMQGMQMVTWYQDIAQTFGQPKSVVATPEFSEDCLYLNVWTPSKAISENQQLPIMVWIHGGSNKGGWSYEPNYFGHQLAKQNVVVISIAYRLGVFGFFSHPQITQEQRQGTNFGLLDQLMALQWVQDNAASLGGDANNITVFGESAGAANIGYLMASPKAKGLFHRAIHQSAGFELLAELSTKDHEQLGLELVQALELPENQQTLAALRQLSSQQILSASTKVHKDHYFSAASNEYLLPISLSTAYNSGQLNKVDLITGSNAAEYYAYNPDVTTAQHINDEINKYPKALRADIRGEIQSETDLKAALDRLVTADQMLCPARLIATQMSTKTPNVFSYFFTQIRDGEGGDLLKAYHGAEIPYVFNTHDHWLPTNQSDQRLTRQMMAYWVNFAKTGNPNGQKLPLWPTLQHQKTMALGMSSTAIDLPDQRLCELFAMTR